MKSYSDFYAFHSLKPGRNFTSDDYRYSVNGQEKETEITGTASHSSAEYWMYDSRIGRRWENDPMTYAWQSSYACFNNNPIVFEDPQGLYGTKKEARQAKRNAQKAGLTPSKIYKSGDEYGFNVTDRDGFTSYFKKKDFGGGSSQNSNLRFLFIGASSGVDRLLRMELKTTPAPGQKPNLSPSKLTRITLSRAFLLTSCLSLSGCNPSYGQVQDQTTNELNALIEEQDIDKIRDLAKDLKRVHQDEIVFRYMSTEEYNNTQGPTWTSYTGSKWPTLVNRDKTGVLGEKYVTPDLYFSSQEAKTLLALPTAPQIVVWTFRNNLRTKQPKSGWDKVEPANGEPGGGNEGTINETFPIRGAFMLQSAKF